MTVRLTEYALPKEIIEECLCEIPYEVDREYICDFILSGQQVVQDIIEQGEDILEDDAPSMGLML